MEILSKEEIDDLLMAMNGDLSVVETRNKSPVYGNGMRLYQIRHKEPAYLWFIVTNNLTKALGDYEKDNQKWEPEFVITEEDEISYIDEARVFDVFAARNVFVREYGPKIINGVKMIAMGDEVTKDMELGKITKGMIYKLSGGEAFDYGKGLER